MGTRIRIPEAPAASNQHHPPKPQGFWRYPDVKLNKALWLLGERMAQLKGAA
ncbi:hypothetical protein [Pseudoroseomonas sp. WGS1072]|uniref:hypothetical protein n=1 Tax=Roseomonas sp. WGS1072 TaxID=3366816 RepID=UPI003BF1D2F1